MRVPGFEPGTRQLPQPLAIERFRFGIEPNILGFLNGETLAALT